MGGYPVCVIYALQAIGFLFALFGTSACGNGDSGSALPDAPPPFYADLRGIMQSQTGLGLGSQSRSFPVWHLMGPWDDASRARFRNSLFVQFSNAASTPGQGLRNVDDWTLSWESVANEPNMAIVTLTMPLTEAGAYTVDVGAWCQKPEWLPWPTVGEIHVPNSDRPWQPMCGGMCTFSLAANSCPGLGDVRTLEFSQTPPWVKVEVTFSEALAQSHRSELVFSFAERCFPDCERPPLAPVPLSVEWRSDRVAVIELVGEQAEKMAANVKETQSAVGIGVRSPNIGFGAPFDVVSAPDGQPTCRLWNDIDWGLYENFWSFPATQPGPGCMILAAHTKTPNPYPEPTEASREQGHPNQYLLPADATP